MGYEYNAEALPTLKQAINNIEEYIGGLNNRISVFETIAEQSGAKKFQEQVSALKEASTSFCTTLADFVGEDGDKAAEGTLKACESTMRKLDEIMN